MVELHLHIRVDDSAVSGVAAVDRESNNRYLPFAFGIGRICDCVSSGERQRNPTIDEGSDDHPGGHRIDDLDDGSEQLVKLH